VTKPGLMGRTAAATLLLYAAPVHAQDCYLTWQPGGSPGGFGSPLFAYDTIRSRILALNFNEFGPAPLYAWTGTGWITLNQLTGPTRRTGGRVAFDRARDRLVAFGGRDPQFQYPTDVWEWNGQAWSVIPTPGFPGRTAGGMIFDEARQRTVLFGGRGTTGLLNDTWLWDGVAWTAVSPSVRPTPRHSHAMTYDVLRQRTLLVAGETSSGRINDFWEFDGVQWTQLPTPPEPGYPPTYEALTFDPVQNRTYRFGRSYIWAYDGTASQWTTLLQFAGPLGPSLGRSIFDPGLSRIVFPQGNGFTVFNPAGTVTPVWLNTEPSGGSFPAGANVVIVADAGGTQPGYQWLRNGQPMVNGGNISGVTEHRLLLTPFTAADVGQYVVVVSNQCSTVSSNGLCFLSLVSPCSAACYANCDQSATCPVLTANDFVCFFAAYNTATSYANCDGMGGLTASDFYCFLSAYANGCS
jgi:hypothetical protein